MTITERAGVVLREARADDLATIDQLTVDGYAEIQESYVATLGENISQAVRHQPRADVGAEEVRSEPRALRRSSRPGGGCSIATVTGFGYGTFWLFAEQQYGHIDNAVRSDETGHGWATFMYRSVLEHFRDLGLRFAHVYTGLDDARSAAGRAYESVGFDRQVPGIEYWQDLSNLNTGSA